MPLFQRLFTDRRLCSVLTFLWCFCIAACLWVLACYSPRSSFWSWGPNSSTSVLGIKLDTWESWGSLATLAFVGTLMHEFITDSIGPWVQNSIQDHKATSVPYDSRLACQLIVSVFTVYMHLASLVSLVLYTTQVDILIIRLVADLMVTAFSTHMFLLDKQNTVPIPSLADIDVALVIEEKSDSISPMTRSPLKSRSSSRKNLWKVSSSYMFSWDSFGIRDQESPECKSIEAMATPPSLSPQSPQKNVDKADDSSGDEAKADDSRPFV